MNRLGLFLLFYLMHLAAFAQTKLVIRDVKGLVWEYDQRYSLLDSAEYFPYSFSVADVVDPKGEWQKLDKCSCRMQRDTVNIWIHNLLAEGGIAVSINVTNGFSESFIQHYSDVEVFASGFYHNYIPEQSTLTVNRPTYKSGDILTGSIDITASNLKTLNMDELTLKGQFQCVIMENKGNKR